MLPKMYTSESRYLGGVDIRWMRTGRVQSCVEMSSRDPGGRLQHSINFWNSSSSGFLLSDRHAGDVRISLFSSVVGDPSASKYNDLLELYLPVPSCMSSDPILPEHDLNVVNAELRAPI